MLQVSSRCLAVAARAATQCGDSEVLSITMAARAFHSAYGGDPAGGLAFAREAVDMAADIDLADAFARDGKPDEAVAQAMLALDIIDVTSHAESLRRANGIYEAIRPNRTAAARGLGSRLLTVKARSVG